MIAANIAPGMNRSFLAEDWKNIIGRKCWYEAMDEANDLVDDSVQVDIQGYDIDGDIVKAARLNAQSAGVDHMIHFQQRPVSALSHPKNMALLFLILLTESGLKRRRIFRFSTGKSESGLPLWTPGLCT